MSESYSGPTDFNGIRDRIVRLLCEGHTTDYVAKALGLSVSRVNTIRKDEFEKRFQDRDRIKQQTALQYDALVRPLMERYLNAGTTCDRKDAEVMATLLRDKRRLFGLDEPVRVEVRPVEELSEAELNRELERYGVPVKQLNPPQPQVLTLEPVAEAEFERLPERSEASSPTPNTPTLDNSDTDSATDPEDDS